MPPEREPGREVVAASGQDPDAVQGAAIHRVTAGGRRGGAGPRRRGRRAHDPRRLRLRTARHPRRRARPPRRARRRRQGAGRWPLAAAGDEAAPRLRRAADRHRAAGRAAVRAGRGRRAGRRRGHPPPRAGDVRSCGRGGAAAGGRGAHGR